MNRAIILASVLGLTAAGASAGYLTFDELPVGSSLDGQTIEDATFTYFANGSTLPPPAISDSPGSVSGIREGNTLRGSGTSEDFVIHMDFHGGVVDDFGLSLSTAPFGFLSPIGARVTFYNAQGEQVIEFASMAQTDYVGAVLPDGQIVF